jgi:hypothetical protein
MTHDPMRQADIDRRLSNLAKARRCGARTRAGRPCRQAAVTERARCRMHGGAKGSGGPRGKRSGNFRHGGWTYESVNLREAMRAKVRVHLIGHCRPNYDVHAAASTTKDWGPARGLFTGKQSGAAILPHGAATSH